ncbi:MAG: hypothetical protein WD278_00135 [Pirellulales bacterium]
MKWNMIVGAFVVSMGLCSQSFGFELLDRMLGLRGGCCKTDCCETSCCEPEPSCHAPQQDCCAPEPSCHAPQQDCCPQQDDCCDRGCGRKRLNLFGHLRGMFDHGGCCQQDDCCEPEPVHCAPEPTCCERDACDSGCGRKRHHCGLLSNLFKSRKKSCCNTGCGGCGGGYDGHGAPAPAAGEAAPMPPAPMADPSASIQGRRSIVQASRTLVHRN